MTQMESAFAQSRINFIDYRVKYHIGIVEFKLSNLRGEISRLDDGRLYRRFSLPCGRGVVVNVTVFSKEHRFLKKLQKNSIYKFRAVIIEKIIINNGSKRLFYNLDLELVHPDIAITARAKVVQSVSKTEEGLVHNCPQGGAIVTAFL